MWFVWDLFEDSEGSTISAYINYWVMFLIVCSSIIAITETIPAIHKDHENLWFAFEFFFVMNFSVEFLCRIISCPDKLLFCRTFMNYIDLVAILPFYIDIVSRIAASGADPPNFGFLRILRLSRAAKLIKMSKYSQGIRLVGNAMTNSVDALQLFALLLTLVLVVFSSGIYYTEQGSWVGGTCPTEWFTQFGISDGGTGYTNSCILNRYYRTDTRTGASHSIEQFPSPFQSIPGSFWWTIVTLTTVGYGDMFPYSWEVTPNIEQ